MASAHQPHASAVRLGGQPVQVDVVLAGWSRLTGTLRAASTGAGDGTALMGATVTLADPRGEVVAAQRTGPDGRYGIEGSDPRALHARAQRAVLPAHGRAGHRV